jgi:hypothetical protein
VINIKEVIKNDYNQNSCLLREFFKGGPMSNLAKILIPVAILVFLILVLVGIPFIIGQVINQTTERALGPFAQANGQLQTQVAQFLHPTPTIIPDPITIIHEVRSLSRLETIQYSVEKVITAETGQGQLSFLFGDRLLFVAHGVVIAGIDLSKLSTNDLVLKDNALYVTLPAPEIFVATLDNEKSYIYDRQTGLLTHGDVNLETQARQVAEEEIRKAALADGILKQAEVNADSYLSRLFKSLGYNEVVFNQTVDQNNSTPEPISALQPSNVIFPTITPLPSQTP